MLGNYLQQTTSADKIFRCIFFLATLRVNIAKCLLQVVLQCINALHFQIYFLFRNFKLPRNLTVIVVVIYTSEHNIGFESS